MLEGTADHSVAIGRGRYTTLGTLHEGCSVLSSNGGKIRVSNVQDTGRLENVVKLTLENGGDFIANDVVTSTFTHFRSARRLLSRTLSLLDACRPKNSGRSMSCGATSQPVL